MGNTAQRLRKAKGAAAGIGLVGKGKISDTQPGREGQLSDLLSNTATLSALPAVFFLSPPSVGCLSATTHSWTLLLHQHL